MKITLFFLLQLAVSAYSLLQEFCVTDLSLPPTPAGYQCRKPSTVTVNDFVFSALDKAANTSNSIKAGVIVALDTQFPALNGVGFSIVRVDFAPGGVIPLHAHNANELLVVIEGTLVAGFIFSSNTAYYKTLRKGHVMVFPEGLLHFQVNTGPGGATGLVSFNRQNPGVQLLPNSLFSNDLPSALIEKSSSLSKAEVKRLKGIFGEPTDTVSASPVCSYVIVPSFRRRTSPPSNPVVVSPPSAHCSSYYLGASSLTTQVQFCYIAIKAY